MENCCDSLFKTLLLIFNLAFAVVGLVLIGFGAYAQLEAKNLLNFLSDDYLNTPVFIIILGGVIFVIAFFGCCGAIRESKCMMYTYGLLLCVILIAQVGAGIAAFAVKGDLNNVIKDNMNKGMTNYGKDDFKGVTETWDAVQNQFECCGVTDWNDWKNQTKFEPDSVPDSCCKGGQMEGCGKNAQDSTKFNTDGCYSKFSDLFVGNLAYVGVTALCVAAAEILVISLACCLGKKMGLNAEYV